MLLSWGRCFGARAGAFPLPAPCVERRESYFSTRCFRFGRPDGGVARRLKTVIEANKVLVIDGGRIDASGTPDDLIRDGGLFARMYEAQSLEAGR